MADVKAVGVVQGGRAKPVDDDWGMVESRIVLDGRFGPEALAGLEAFSHVEVVYEFHLVAPGDVEEGARHPRGREDWPEVGIFAQRGKDRPNRIGVTTCRLLGVEGTELRVRGLDAVDGTPVLDIKPYMAEFAPRGEVRQPVWSHALMSGYWGDDLEDGGGQGVAALVASFADRMERRDWEGFRKVLHPEVVYEVPQTRERIRGRDRYVTFNVDYPGDWHLTPQVVLGDTHDGALLFEWTIDGGEPALAVAFFQAEDGLITKVTDFWPEPYDPPPGREHLVERY